MKNEKNNNFVFISFCFCKKYKNTYFWNLYSIIFHIYLYIYTYPYIYLYIYVCTVWWMRLQQLLEPFMFLMTSIIIKTNRVKWKIKREKLLGGACLKLSFFFPLKCSLPLIWPASVYVCLFALITPRIWKNTHSSLKLYIITSL